MSNALLVTGKESRTGKPLAVMGPQTGYFAPQLLVEQVLNGPGIQARGVAFAGTNLFVQLGRGVDYAWSATSSGSDNIDTVVEKLCNTNGTKATVNSTGYLVGKKCVPMQSDVHTETTTPNLTAPGPATTYKFQVLRTRHGIVQERTTVGGKPVALVLQRSTYGHEVDSVLGFGELNDPGFVHNAKTFQKAASDIDYTFNWFYADSKDISYYSSGLLPKRSKKVEPDLPHWAGKKYDWKGWLSFKRHARETNPKRGYLVSWNNKPAPDFSAADDTWSYGAVYRSLALEKRLTAKIRGKKKIDLPGMVGVMAGGATADSRAAYTLKWLLKVIGKDPKTAAARALLAQWLKAGAPRADRDRNGAYEYQAAIALFDSWWEDGSQLGGVRRHVRSARVADPPAAAEPRRPPAAGPGLVVQRRRLVRLPLQGPPLGPREARRRPLLHRLLRQGLAQGLPRNAAGVARRRRGAGAAGAGQVLGRPAHLRQGRGRHPLQHRRRRRRRPDRLAEPPDLPAGDQLLRPSVASWERPSRRVGSRRRRQPRRRPRRAWRRSRHGRAQPRS